MAVSPRNSPILLTYHGQGYYRTNDVEGRTFHISAAGGVPAVSTLSYRMQTFSPEILVLHVRFASFGIHYGRRTLTFI